MRELGMLGLVDLLALGGGIALGNAITVGFFALLGLSEVPAGAAPAVLAGSYLAVVLAFSLVPTVVVILLAYLSSQMY